MAVKGGMGGRYIKSIKSIDSPLLRRYNVIAVDSFQQEGGAHTDYIIAFLISVLAGIVGHFICKWLDRDK